MEEHQQSPVMRLLIILSQSLISVTEHLRLLLPATARSGCLRIRASSAPLVTLPVFELGVAGSRETP